MKVKRLKDSLFSSHLPSIFLSSVRPDEHHSRRILRRRDALHSRSERDDVRVRRAACRKGRHQEDVEPDLLRSVEPRFFSLSVSPLLFLFNSGVSEKRRLQYKHIEVCRRVSRAGWSGFSLNCFCVSEVQLMNDIKSTNFLCCKQVQNTHTPSHTDTHRGSGLTSLTSRSSSRPMRTRCHLIRPGLLLAACLAAPGGAVVGLYFEGLCVCVWGGH